ncbi:hypothetical protein HMPREF9401_1451 [Aliarcobacter butzleri JV22]|uniref:hypothetical protein n=1 Tax=Aliarcobacter butzleri TaxID=28197 RepID=UPI0001F0ED1B|nr:hypothetical protein [Aliarcobacter butzleri]EFU69577.1 hypothetical protein HMPREF9401_1451 [Aliarcobacter butzleri JV22]
MLFQSKKKKEEKEFNNEVNLAISIELERFGEANSYHFRSQEELSKIAKYKINPNYENNNYHQQAGFSAEIKTEARTNASNAVNKSNERISRTDNIGSVNHTKYDHVKLDSRGNPILDSNGDFIGGSQQKMHKEIKTYKKYAKKELFEKYKSTPIDVPKEQLQDILNMYDADIKNLEKQETNLRRNGNNELANNKAEEIKRTKDVKSRFRDSKVTIEEALEARKNHNISIAKDIVKVSHQAGLEAAKYGGGFTVIFSSIKNIFSVKNKEKEVYEALKDISLDTGKATLLSYSAGFSTTAVQGLLKSTNKQILQNMSKGNLPAAIIQTGLIIGKQAKDLALGKISFSEFNKNIGKEGHILTGSMAGANLGAIIGTVVFPGAGTIVGGVIGGISASIITGMMHSELMKSINDIEVSNKRREEIQKYCNKLIEQEREYRKNMSDFYDTYLDAKEREISKGFERISLSIIENKDITNGLKIISNSYGFDIKFQNKEDFRSFIKSGKTLGID